jgi:hypothetical protein
MGLAFFLWGLLAPLVARIFRPKPVAPGAARA